MLAIGSVYGWGVIAAQLTEYDADEKNVIGTTGTLFVYVTYHTGIFYDRFGARASLVLGGSLAVSGWLLTIWGITMRHPAWLVGLYQAICGQSVQPVMLAALETVNNFPPQRKGIYSSIVLTGFGLTSIVMAQISKHMFPGNLLGFLWTLAVSAGVLISFQFIVFATPKTPPLASGLVPSGSVAHLKDLLSNRKGQLFIFIMICFGMELYFFVVNVAALNAASGGGQQVPDIVTTFGLCNVLARPVVGLSSDFVPLSRAQLLALGSCLCACGMAVLMMRGTMLIAATLVGLSDGFMFAVWVPLTREVHGNANYGITFSTYLMTLGIGDIIINFVMIHIFDTGVSNTSAGVCCVAMVLAACAALFLHKGLLST